MKPAKKTKSAKRAAPAKAAAKKSTAKKTVGEGRARQGDPVAPFGLTGSPRRVRTRGAGGCARGQG